MYCWPLIWQCTVGSASIVLPAAIIVHMHGPDPKNIQMPRLFRKKIEEIWFSGRSNIQNQERVLEVPWLHDFAKFLAKHEKKPCSYVKNTCKFLCFIYKMLFGFIEFNFFFHNYHNLKFSMDNSWFWMKLRKKESSVCVFSIFFT